MAKTYVQLGDVLEVTLAADRTAGQGVLIGTLFGVALHDALSGAVCRIGTTGVFNLAADTNLVISAGDRVFWDAGNNWVDKTLTAQQCIGVATVSKGTTDATINVLLGPRLLVAS